jgi:hypothetical protein
MLGPYIYEELKAISKRYDKLLKSSWPRGAPSRLAYILELMNNALQAETDELRRRKKERETEERHARDIRRVLDEQRGIIHK